MTNWQTFKIMDKSVFSDWMKFCLDDYVKYNDRSIKHIFCVKTYPYDNCQRGSYLEIDLDRTIDYSSVKSFNDTNIVREATPNAMVRSWNQNQTLTVGRQINALIDQNERNKYEAKIQVDPDTGKINGYSITGWRK